MDYCGIDLHQDKSYVCIPDEEGDVIERRTVRTTRRALSRHSRVFVEDGFIMQ